MGIFVLLCVIVLYIRTLYRVVVAAGNATMEMSSKQEIPSRTSKTGEIEMQSASTQTNNSPPRSTSTDSPPIHMAVRLQHVAVKLVQNICKNTLLGFIGLTSTLLLNVRTIYLLGIYADGDPIMWRCLASLDGAINIICMYLIFVWTDRQYNFLCFACDRALRRGCILMTKKSIIKKETQKDLQVAVR